MRTLRGALDCALLCSASSLKLCWSCDVSGGDGGGSDPVRRIGVMWMGVGGGLLAPFIPWVGVNSWKVGVFCFVPVGGLWVRSVMLPLVDACVWSAIGVAVPCIGAGGKGVTSGKTLGGGESARSVGVSSSSSVSPWGSYPGSLAVVMCLNFLLLAIISCVAGDVVGYPWDASAAS